ncbi:type I secretion system permease/ATPase [Sphaerotilus mobilis]|uniref:Cyclolysin secretion/processing ATP-binding protein CyaB n=1 Tax=Sphaerotilus mobilis TaxID=47994 RepID=A0A4Q7LQG2_9BURK|nr:type I secretion system permease/ATPase [Sphaerotilus mobilis]RZS56884.1 ATP-binding cassette subfamily C protein LapB [Sphaerotilus mobilis]
MTSAAAHAHAPDAYANGGRAVVDSSDDALLGAVIWLIRHHGVQRTPQSLLDGLGIAQMLTPPLAVRVLDAAGFNASVVEREPRQILALLLPAILLLRNGDACVLVERVVRGQQVAYRMLMPPGEPGGAPVEVLASEAELQAEYSGHVLMATPRLGAPLAGRRADDDLVNPRGHWLWSTLRRFMPYYRGAMLAALLSNVLMLFIGLFTSVVYDRVIPNQAFVTLWSLAAGAGLAIVFDLIARQLRSHLIDQAGKKADLALGAILFRKALSVRLEHRPESSGSFAHHLAQLEVVRDFSTSATMSAISDLPFIFLFIAMIWFVGGPLVVVLLIAVPLILALTVGVQHVLRKASTANQRQQADMQGIVIESMEGIETVRAASAQGHFQRQYEESNAMAAQAALRARALSSWVNNLTMVSQQIITVVMLVWGVHLIAEGHLTAGALISAVMFAGRVVAPLGGVVSLASRYQGARAALRMLDQLMAQPSERDPAHAYLPRARISGQIGLRDTAFAYSQSNAAGATSQGPTVLKGINLRIEAGERVAILGKIGSGKSTVLRLLGGLYLPTEGYTEVDGIDLRQIDPADYRAQVGFVAQEPRLFRGSLRDNILLSRSHASASTLAEVLRLTGLDRVAAAHPQGIEMPVGEGGRMLSGGQRQLVALARCLVTSPKVLLMDEPTSSMDAQSEMQFIAQLRPLVRDRTLVVVTHRPALLELVERIVVVDGGKVVIDGPKQAVLQALAGGPKPGAALPQQGVTPGALNTGIYVGPAGGMGQAAQAAHAGRAPFSVVA